MFSRVGGSRPPLSRTVVRSEEPTTLSGQSLSHSGAPLSVLVAENGTSVQCPLLAGGTFILGRSRTADLVLKGPLVSREHAAIHTGNILQIEDLGSANGTWVAGRRLSGGVRVPLQPGEAVCLGTAVLLVTGSPTGDITHRQPIALQQMKEQLKTLTAAPPPPGIGLVRIRLHDRHRNDFVAAFLPHFLDTGDKFAWTGEQDLALVWSGIGEQSIAARALSLADRFHAWRIAADVYHRFVGAGAALAPADLLAQALAFLSPSETSGEGRGPVVASGPIMQQLYRDIDRVASVDISVLITGETGVGKDVIASAIHDRSPRRAGPFVRINCAALSASILESELFGHEAGAFTGTKGAKPGLLETAHHGTIFLDEIGELPLTMQAKLLHALESHEVTRVGGVKPRRIDVRFLSATNRQLENSIRQGEFRSDLYFRLNGFTVTVPPLRQRQTEIEGLANLFLGAMSRRLGKLPPLLTTEALRLLCAHWWPGNIRELKNVSERVLLFSSSERITPADLVAAGFVVIAATGPTVAMPSVAQETSGPDQRASILAALEACAGNQSRAAKTLGMPRRSLVRRLAALEIPRPRASHRKDTAKPRPSKPA